MFSRFALVLPAVMIAALGASPASALPMVTSGIAVTIGAPSAPLQVTYTSAERPVEHREMRYDGPARFDNDDVRYGDRPVEVRFDRRPLIERREVRYVRRGRRLFREVVIVQEPRPFYRDMHRDDDRRRI